MASLHKSSGTTRLPCQPPPESPVSTAPRPQEARPSKGTPDALDCTLPSLGAGRVRGPELSCRRRLHCPPRPSHPHTRPSLTPTNPAPPGAWLSKCTWATRYFFITCLVVKNFKTKIQRCPLKISTIVIFKKSVLYLIGDFGLTPGHVGSWFPELAPPAVGLTTDCLGSPEHSAAKLLQSCPTLCDPIDGSPPGSPVPGILQARTLEWVAISFSNA